MSISILDTIWPTQFITTIKKEKSNKKKLRMKNVCGSNSFCDFWIILHKYLHYNANL